MAQPPPGVPGDPYDVKAEIRKADTVRKLLVRRSRRVTHRTRLAGPLCHDARDPVPLTKEEEAYLVAAAVGITGPIHPDLPYTEEGGGRTMMSLFGRTIASPDAAHTLRLIVVNDAGAWYIRGPWDFGSTNDLLEVVKLARDAAKTGDWTRWYDKVRERISYRRARIPSGTLYQAAFNRHSTNLGGTTYFLPIADVSGFYLNVAFAAFEEKVGWVLRDLRNGGRPAFQEKYLRSPGGPLNEAWETQVPMEFFTDMIRGWTGNERGQMFANLALAAQDIHLDGFPHFGGSFYAWAEELDFERVRVPCEKLARGPSWLRYQAHRLFLKPTPYSVLTWLLPSLRTKYKRHAEIPVGLRDLVQPYCPPYYPNMRAAVEAFVKTKFATLSSQLEGELTKLEPESAAKLRAALTRFTGDEIDRVVSHAEYVFDRYGIFPRRGEPGPLSFLEAYQVHVVDPEYYARYYGDESLTPDQQRRARAPVLGTSEPLPAEAERLPPISRAVARRGPPWKIELDHVVLVYSVPPEAVARRLPEGLSVALDGKGGAELVLGFNHITDVQTRDVHGRGIPPYDEITAAVRVRHDSGSEGTFYLKLHLDQRIPTEMGIVHYGYPKELASVQRYEEEGRIRFRAWGGRQLLYDIEIETREELRARLGAVWLWGKYLLGQMLDPGLTKAFFERAIREDPEGEARKELWQARFGARAKMTALRSATVRRIRVPYIDRELGIRVSAMKPLFATHSHFTKAFSLEPERVTGDPAPLRERLRLKLVQWLKRRGWWI
jgi:hypothetical protein